ncbi:MULTISPECIES: hypothetical protein [unclassified Serratia (in: enterobacteria)]|uniref:hypothetical protein n=1 Tax=unclassified Serratia (in: enterobacteria) TaxID=2647522 RepID=UPI002ED212C4|nr:hypothetical protein [Serratia sp. C2(2)]MEE4449676.1 hypothetical protein [Serratia sp. C2(1)]
MISVFYATLQLLDKIFFDGIYKVCIYILMLMTYIWRRSRGIEGCCRALCFSRGLPCVALLLRQAMTAGLSEGLLAGCTQEASAPAVKCVKVIKEACPASGSAFSVVNSDLAYCSTRPDANTLSDVSNGIAIIGVILKSRVCS